MFENRRDAGRQLAELLRRLRLERPVILGIPRGGVPVAAEIARGLDCELGVVVARKLGAPGQPELGIGAVASDGTVFIDASMVGYTGASEAYLEREIAQQQEEAQLRERSLRGPAIPLEGRDVVVVDDGMATGATAVAAIRSVRAAGAGRAILAVPVAPPATLAALGAEADEIVCPLQPEDFGAVGRFYVDFAPVAEHEVRKLLDEARARSGSTA